MRVLLIGATGTIGKAIAAALSKHEVLGASRNSSDFRVDLSKPDSIRELFSKVGRVDAVISAAGEAKFAPFASLTDEDYAFCLANKLMGQVNVVRYGMDHVNDRGMIIITSGVLAQEPMKGAAAISLVNAGLEGFARGAALEAPRGIRVNVVSPGWVTETLVAFGMDPSIGLPAAEVGKAYARVLESSQTGQVVVAKK